ncbi:MAG: MarR family winged helix-turn-helix transcriptional regulator [Chloroflexota bacterium]
MNSNDRAIDNPKHCLNANLRKASRAITKLYVSALADTGLQGTQFTLLSTISGYKDCTITELARYLVMDQTTVTRSVEKLRQRGYVEVFTGEDRRERILRLTSEGERIVQVTYPKWRDVQTRVWKQLGSEKAHQLLELIDEIVELSEDV